MQVIVDVHGLAAAGGIGGPPGQAGAVGVAGLDEVGPVVGQLVGQVPVPAGVGPFALGQGLEHVLVLGGVVGGGGGGGERGGGGGGG